MRREVSSWSERSQGSISLSMGDDGQKSGREKKNWISKKLVKILMPNTKFRLSWEFFIFIVIWYNSVMTPIRLLIMTGERTPEALISADLALDVIFVFDTALHFFRPYTDKDTGHTVTNLRQIKSKYLRSVAFYMNVAACIPILKTPLAPLLDAKKNIAISTNFNILRMTRIFHFPAQFEELKAFLSRKDPVNESVFRMGMILFFTQLIMCIFGTVYFGWSSSTVDDICPGPSRFAQDVLGNEMWIAGDEVIVNVMDPQICIDSPTIGVECNDCPQLMFFLRSVYFLMQTLFTIGYGDTVVPSKLTAEVAMTCVFMLFGVFGYGLIIANMTSVLSNIDVVSMRFRHEMDTVNKWLAFRSVPTSLRERVEMFFTYLERSQHGILDDTLFEGLPTQLSREISETNISLIEKVPFFNPDYRSKDFLSKISLALVRRIYPPGSYVLYEGEKQRELIIVKQGSLNLYLRAASEVVANLVEGDYIGDYQLFFGTVNQVGAISPAFTEVLTLTFHAFEDIMDHPSQTEIDFRTLGGNLRRSKDQGAIDTLEQAKVRMKKIAFNASNLKSQPKSKKMMDMLEKIEVKVNGLRILPTYRVRVFWDVFAVLAIMFEAISVPMQIAVYIRASKLRSAYSWMFLIHYFIDIAFLSDLYLRMNTYTYTSFDGGRSETVVDRKMIRDHYLRSQWFRIDCLAIIPFDLLSLVIGHYTLLRVPKMTRVIQLPSTVSRLRKNLDTCFGTSVNERTNSGIIMFLSTILIIVWSSAGWNALRYNESGYKAVYWALTTLTTVGYGDFTPNNFRETVYAVIVGALGATFTAGIIANVTSFFHDVDISEENIDHKVNCIMRFMENHSRPLEQIKKIQEYFDYTEREQGGINEDLLLRKALPDHLRTNLLIHMTHSMIANCDFFSNCEAGFLRQLMRSLDQRFFGSQSMILTASIPSDGMYFIKKGTVDLTSKASSKELKPFKRLDADGYFAEECLLEHWDENPYLAISVTDCELWHLRRSVFNRIVDDFPHVRVHLTKIARSSKLKGDRRGSMHAMAKAIKNVKRKSKMYIHPDNYFIQIWFGLILVVTIYSAISLPFRFAFMENYEISTNWVVLDYCGDFFLIVDVIIRSTFLAYYDDNHLTIDKRQIWRHYTKHGKLKWHILSILPIELTMIGNTSFCPLWKLQVWSLYRMNRLLRLIEVPALMSRVEKTLAKIGVRVPKNAIRVGKLIMVILLSAHFVACIFYTIANFNQYFNADGGQQNWADNEGLFLEPLLCPGNVVNTDIMMKRYVASMYWAMATLTTVGYGDITAHEDSIVEILFATMILVIGTAIYTLVIALLEDIVSQLDVTSSLHKMRTDKVDSYCELESLPDGLKVKIDAHYDNLWNKQLGVNGKTLLTFFPTSFKTEMLLDMVSPLLHKTFFIKDCTADFAAQILNCMKYELFLPDDTLFCEGERCQSLHFLYKGGVNLLNAKGVKFKTASNCVLGEAPFFGFEPHLCSAKTADACEIFSFSMEDFILCIHENDLIKQYVEYLEKNKGHLQKSKESVAKMIRNLKSSKMEKMMVTEQQASVPKGVVLPEAVSRFIWELLLLLQTISFTFIIPFEISFLSNGIGVPIFIVDTVMDIVFMMDVYARLKKFAIMKDGYLLTEPVEFRSLYFHSDFGGDVLSLIPLSFTGYLFGVRDGRYGLLRIVQFVRIRQFGNYLSSVVENVNARTKFNISNAQLRIMQIFFVVLFLCHWFACIFHLLGNMPEKETWLITDESMSANNGGRYLRSFYWALYTVTTIGYGSVPVVTNIERIFAMMVMIVGAVICDAGITAILTSIISIRDQQSGANNRRIQCCKRFMSTNAVSKETQERVMGYYKYDDTELHNIREDDVLEDLSISLRNEVLRHFCFKPLRSIDLCNGLTDGALLSLIQMMEPYLAVPNEHLSIIKEKCQHLYILKRGDVKTVDCSGTSNLLPLGSVVGHLTTESTYKQHGLRSRILEIQVVGGKSFKTKYGNPYIIFTFGSTSCRSSIKKEKYWEETVTMKTCHTDPSTLNIDVRSWQNGQVHSLIGSSELPIKIDSADKSCQLAIRDANGKSAGVLHLNISYRPLRPHEMLETHEKNTTTLGYCHLYRFDSFKFDDLKQYLDVSSKENVCDRLRGPFLEHILHDAVTDKERIKNYWRRPSKPSICIKNPVIERSKSRLGHREAIQRPSIFEDNEIASKSENGGRPLLQKMKGAFGRARSSRSIFPMGDEDDPEKGLDLLEGEARPSWSGSNKVRTKTLAAPSERSIRTETDTSLSEKDCSWDILADVNGEEALSRLGTRRATVFIEWNA